MEIIVVGLINNMIFMMELSSGYELAKYEFIVIYISFPRFHKMFKYTFNYLAKE